MVPENIQQRPLNFPAPLRCGVLLLLLLLVVLPATAGPEGTGKRYALLVGVGAYQHWSPLANPVPDVRALAAELRHRYGFLPELLENPTREDVIAKLRRYFSIEYRPQDQLVIVFAGHGTYDEVSRIGYLVARDSENRQLDPNFVSLLNYPWLLTLIDNIDCPNILLVVDACYSGSLGDTGGDASARGATTGTSWRNRHFLTSGGKEYVPDGDPDRHTPFVRQLLTGLRSLGSAGALSLEQLQNNFMSRIEPRPRWGRFGGEAGEGDFVFVAQGSGPAPHLPVVAPEDSPAVALRSKASGPRTPRSKTSPTAALPEPKPASVSQVAPTGLRSQRKDVAENELKRIFYHLELFDKGWNPEGGFPNEYRVQNKGLWDVVIDLESRLMWQWSGSDHRMSPEEAKEYISELNKQRHAGYRDWRLPTVEELASLLEPERQSDSLYLSPHFDTEQETCWSADRSLENKQPYYVSFNSGRTVLAFGNKMAFVRAVRPN